jgi:hypothetical protein
LTGKPTPDRATSGENLINDPGFPWAEGCPYDVVNARLRERQHPLIGPESRREEVFQAGHALQGLARRAWDQLRKVPERVKVDFFHYPLPDLRIDALDPAALERPMPVADPDLMSMADCEVELAAPEAPARLAFQDVTAAAVIDFDLSELLPSPLCGELPKFAEMIEMDDDKQ